ncbi:ATP-NAD kinase family protein [Aestuariibacter salexigens]|uniref:ATP-NAD kinase family protein n=1 Tax=Aestuariibacter salexigens TaxID=226010 RepID=UPI00040012B0|nr:ATP-NAD kinase family protein [Aestuariibacter salexigens]
MPERLSSNVFKLGLVVNPFAGIGGALALKGSDGAEIRERALAMGAVQQAMAKTKRALQSLVELKSNVMVYTAAGDMGQSVCMELDLPHQVVYEPQSNQTEPEDTLATCRILVEQGIDLLVFAGGDGTARNVSEIVNMACPVVGIPAGCKIHSGVFAITPSAAGAVVASVVRGELVSIFEGEVRDIDENAFRSGNVIARHFGELQVPKQLEYIQSVKMGGRESDELVLADIAAHVIELMDESPDAYFVMGSGSTVDFIMEELGLENTLLGVDVVQNGHLVASDVTATELLSLVQHQPCKLVLTLIGGQGHVLGRGNQQLSADVVRSVGRENMLIVATKNKINALEGRPLIADSGDETLDAELSGLIPIITGYHDQVLYQLR